MKMKKIVINKDDDGKTKRSKLKLIFQCNQNKWLAKELISVLIQEPNNIVRSWISILRQEGLTIISKKKQGYKFTTDKQEIEEFAKNEIRKNAILIRSYQRWLNKIKEEKNEN